MQKNEQLDELLMLFQASLEMEDWSPKSILSYVSHVRSFAAWYSETYHQEFAAEAVVQRDIQEHRAWMIGKSEPAAAETINRRLVSLRKFFGWIGGENPAADVKSMKIVDPGVQAISMAELRRLLREVHVHKNVRDIAILELLCHTGIRVGELVEARLADIDMSEKRGSIKIRHGKGRTSREIPLNNDVRKALSAWLEVRPDRGDHLFMGQRGEQSTASGIWRIVRKYGDYAGIADLHVHQLRHTVLTRLVREKGIDLPTVARISGHSSINTLQRYAAPSKDDLERAMEGLSLTD
ncbi:MAG: tyrosine-type recombinase/integrase [Armatimonadota bacterium]